MEKILYLEKRGCDFIPGDPINTLSDIGNYRVCTAEANIAGENGKIYFLEFTGGMRYKYRTKNKFTGKPLKKAVKELINANGLWIDAQYTDEAGSSFGDSKLETEIDNQNLSYTKKNILKVVNHISKDCYTRIEFIN